MSPRAARACLVLAVLSPAAAARAMSLTNRFTPMALSADGSSVLVRADVRGPEGGGQLAFEVWSAGAPHRERFAKGDIDETEYRARLEVLRTNRPNA